MTANLLAFSTIYLSSHCWVRQIYTLGLFYEGRSSIMNLDKLYSVCLECMKPQVQLLLWKKRQEEFSNFGHRLMKIRVLLPKSPINSHCSSFLFFFCCCDKYPEKKQTRTSNSVSSVALFPTSLLLLNVPKPSQIALPAGGQLFKHKESKEDITYSNHNKLILKLDFNT